MLPSMKRLALTYPWLLLAALALTALLPLGILHGFTPARR
jgi:hypothetical protein